MPEVETQREMDDWPEKSCLISISLSLKLNVSKLLKTERKDICSPC